MTSPSTNVDGDGSYTIFQESDLLSARPTLRGSSSLGFLNPRTWPRSVRLALLGVISLSALILLILAPHVPLGLGYHDFADKRSCLGLPNALDVLSNIPFVLVGGWGLFWLSGKRGEQAFLDDRERIPYQVFFAGVLLTGFGSFWYHMAPSDARLPWDLLPMTCSFTSVVVATYMERVNLRAGYLALMPALLLGASSVAYWVFTSSLGSGEYKFYLFVQFFSPVLLGLIVGFFPPRYSGLRYLATAFALYVAAKLFEVFDSGIYNRLGHAVSGHSLKHVTAAVACFWILMMLRERHPFTPESVTTGSCLSQTSKAVSS